MTLPRTAKWSFQCCLLGLNKGIPGDREQVGAFVQIAESTSITKVSFAGRPSVLLRDHVVYVMAKMLWPKAILASVPGMLGYDV